MRNALPSHSALVRAFAKSTAQTLSSSSANSAARSLSGSAGETRTSASLATKDSAMAIM